MEPSDEILDLAGAILDGRAIDWSTAESAVPGSDRPLARELHILADLAHLHRSLSPELSADQTRCPFLPAAEWGHLRLMERIGHGRYGDVFRAWDTRLDCEVAVKFVNARSSIESGSTVFDEGRLLARVRHPNVVSVYGAERIGEWIGVWTEFVRGRTLEQVLNEHGVFSAHEAAGVGMQVCRALAAVHSAGLLHRDIKAPNVMREDGGRIVLMDLGAAAEHLVGGARRDIAGTPLYLAPEVLNGAPASTYSDIYSVGVLLYRLVTNSYPVTGGSLDEIREAHAEGRRTLLRDIRPELPDDFVSLVEQAIDPIPERRIQSAGAFDRALRIADAHAAPIRRRQLRRVIGRAAAAMAAVAAIVFGVLQVGRLRSGRARPPADSIKGQIGPAPAIRAVTAPAMGLFRAGAPSFDGRFYSNTDLNEDLLVIDLANGTSHRLTNKGDSDEMAEFSVVSPDGEWIAYGWLTLDDVYELRIVKSNGTRPRMLVGRGHAQWIVPIEWSRDSSQILCLFYQSGGLAQLALVRVADGGARVLRDFRGSLPQRVSLSPDNRFVTYDLPSNGKTTGQRDIFIAPTDGGDARVLVTHPADDTSPAWTPDGDHLFFLSDRTGTVDGWIVPVTDGVVRADPFLAARNIGRVALSGFTSSGALYYWRQTGLVDVFTVPIDGPRPSPPAPSRIPSEFVGSNIGGSWSPDGRSFAFLSQRWALPRSPGATVVVIRDVKSGTVRELSPDLKLALTAPRWSRDGRTLLVRGSTPQNEAGVFLLDVASGDISPGVVAEGKHASDVGRFAWWVDGRSIVYNSPRGIAVRDIAAGTDFFPFDATGALTGFRVAQFEPSPDGRSVAFSGVVDRTNPPARVVEVMPIGGSPRELVRVTYPEQVFLQGWMPNGNELLFTRRNVGVNGPHELWRVALDDGRVVDTGIGIPGFTQINQAAVHPDGKTIAYTGGEASWTLWVMEHFLPEQTR